ncbi:hypothetical protein DFR42_102559 [Undibacterium pigrum]|uniref:Uncharacterized protein n=2 Tax=Undibacterium pigrum TaxID=401470 RepID=A0A318JMW6_9BURK|nr:hypothetical protein DFR42_102559 [Undibacterium pigrum]
MQSTIETDQDSSNQQSEMRVLTESEMLSVAGGPEVDVESGGGG